MISKFSKLFSVTSLAFAVLAGVNAQAKNCVMGKACGNSCISKNDVCHLGSRGVSSGTTAEPVAHHRVKHSHRLASRHAKRAAKNNISSGTTQAPGQYTTKRVHRAHFRKHK